MIYDAVHTIHNNNSLYCLQRAFVKEIFLCVCVSSNLNSTNLIALLIILTESF